MYNTHYYLYCSPEAYPQTRMAIVHAATQSWADAGFAKVRKYFF